MQNLLKDLEALLAREPAFASDGKALKNKVVEAALALNPALLKLLTSNKAIKEQFFADVGGTLVFDKVKFQKFISNKEFLPDSYTAFKNKIGLADEAGAPLAQTKDVVLTWAYKDCVLEGGQDKEDAKRNEIFYNETLAPDDITRLFDPKVLTGFEKWDAEAIKNGKYKEVNDFTRDGNGTIRDNLLIKGNNLLALHSLKSEFSGKVKLIYIDPPYNTGSDSFGYNDSFNHSTWLTFMKNRLEVARELLRSDGSIYVHLDYNEVHYCKIVMDEVFGRENFQREIIWDIRVLSGYKTIANNWVRGHDSILFYSKSKNIAFNKLRQPHTQEYLDSFNKVDKDGRYYMVAHGLTRYRDEVEPKGKPYGDVWDDIMSFQQQPTSKERMFFDGQKPEKLLQRIIEASSNVGDIVLDYHAGTGTTAAVATKLKRQWISIEQLDYIKNLPEERIRNVIAGDEGGISKEIGWKGGGEFIYCQLMQWNESYVPKIRAAKSGGELEKIYADMKANAVLHYDYDENAFDGKAFAGLDLETQRSILMDLLNKNHLYVLLTEIEDATYNVSAEDKKLNAKFYNRQD
jgi:adenine-specific DNA-methyltransferase